MVRAEHDIPRGKVDGETVLIGKTTQNKLSKTF